MKASLPHISALHFFSRQAGPSFLIEWVLIGEKQAMCTDSMWTLHVYRSVLFPTPHPLCFLTANGHYKTLHSNNTRSNGQILAEHHHWLLIFVVSELCNHGHRKDTKPSSHARSYTVTCPMPDSVFFLLNFAKNVEGSRDKQPLSF